MKDIRIGSNPKKMGFWIGFGWETLNPQKKPNPKNPNPKNIRKSKPQKNPKIHKIQTQIHNHIFLGIFKFKIQLK
jgi:hypothetical protein